MADRHLKRPFTGRHDNYDHRDNKDRRDKYSRHENYSRPDNYDHHDRQFHHKKPRYQTQNSSPFARPAESVPQVTLASDLPPAPEIDEKYSMAVFTHESAASKDPSKAGEIKSYEQLEFLGDAYLEVIASELIFDRFINLPAGRMSQVRESLVKNETLSRLTEAYGWDKKIKGNHLQRGPPQSWLKIKGDVFEAYIAAIVLSHQDGLQIAKAWLQTLWASALDSVAAKPPASDQSKVELAKRISGSGVKINYVDEKPPIVHKGQGVETYFVGVYLDGWGWDNQFLGSGKGLSRNAAGQEAAAAAMKNRPLIDEIMAKRAAIRGEREKEQMGACLNS